MTHPRQVRLKHVAATARLLPHFEQIVSSLKPLPWEGFDERVADLTARVIAVRQLEALQSIIRLSGVDLGHLAVAFVRQATEEYLWIEYIATLSNDHANRVLLALGRDDNYRGVSAARRFIGDTDMENIGFPESFLARSDVGYARNLADMATLANELGWPRGKGRAKPPSSAWIAEKVGKRGLYDYLYAASSRAVHFSAGEAFRRGWATADGAIQVTHPAHRDYLVSLAAHHLVTLFINTLLAADAFLDMLDDDWQSSEFESAFQAFAETGRVPIVTPEEFNLREGQQPPSAAE